MQYTIHDFIKVDEQADVVNINLSGCVYDPNTIGSVKDEYVNVLNKVDADKIVVLYSGGIDSEIVLEALKETNKKYEAAIMRYIIDGKPMNDYDYEYALKYCEKNNVSYQFYDLDLPSFLESGDFILYADRYKCRSPQLCCHMWLMDQIDDFVVLGGDLVTLIDGKLSLFKNYMYMCYYRYLALTGKKGIGNMGVASPGIIASTLKAHKKLHEHGYHGASVFRAKHFLIEAGGFVTDRRTKYTGFENIKRYYSDKYNEQHTVRMFDKLFRKPIETRYPDLPIKLILNDLLKQEITNLSGVKK